MVYCNSFIFYKHEIYYVVFYLWQDIQVFVLCLLNRGYVILCIKLRILFFICLFIYRYNVGNDCLFSILFICVICA
jgi:hypothetical protein